jgi:hypothetical protein
MLSCGNSLQSVDDKALLRIQAPDVIADVMQHALPRQGCTSPNIKIEGIDRPRDALQLPSGDIRRYGPGSVYKLMIFSDRLIHHSISKCHFASYLDCAQNSTIP